MNVFDLTGKRALVTGGSRGIGKGIALGLAAAGAEVALVYRQASEEAQGVLQAIRGGGRRAWTFQQDLADIAGIPAFVERAWTEAGPFDVLVNNAGVATLEPYDRVTLETWNRTLNRQARLLNV